jgi:type I restriction enzyme M protein
MHTENPTDGEENVFFVPFCEIKENGYDLSLSKYKEIEYEEIEYEKPEVILVKIEALEDQIKANIAELRELLKLT